MNAKNYKNKRREAKKIRAAPPPPKKKNDVRVLEGTEEANKRNETRKFYTTAHEAKAGFRPRASICKHRDNNLTGNDRLIMGRWRQ
jgi:hypothetical protein